MSLAVALVFGAAASCDGCDPELPPAPTAEDVAPPPLPFRTIRGEGWTMAIPADWEQSGESMWIGPDRANVSVSTKYFPLPLDLVTDAVRADLARGLEDFVVVEEKMGMVGKLQAYEVLSQYSSPGGQRLSVTTVLVDGGKNKHLLTLTVLASGYPDNAETFGRVVQSFDAPYEPVAAPSDDDPVSPSSESP